MAIGLDVLTRAAKDSSLGLMMHPLTAFTLIGTKILGASSTSQMITTNVTKTDRIVANCGKSHERGQFLHGMMITVGRERDTFVNGLIMTNAKTCDCYPEQAPKLTTTITKENVLSDRLLEV